MSQLNQIAEVQEQAVAVERGGGGAQESLSFDFVPGPWWSMRRNPRFPGPYEYRTSDGATGGHAIYAGDGVWSDRPQNATSWRGRVMAAATLPEAQRVAAELPHRNALAAYMGDRPETHEAAAHGALWLARLAAVMKLPEKNREAYRLYQITYRIRPAILEDMDRAWQTKVHDKNQGAFEEIEASVQDYFDLRGEADHNGNPAGNPRLAIDGLVPVESIHGTYVFHLGRKQDTSKGLCGARTMKTGLSLAQWGGKSHLGERYCEQCVGMLPAALRENLGQQPAK